MSPVAEKTQTQLRIAPNLELPLDFLLRSAVIYGAPESGKTTTATVIAEEAWRNRVRFCAIDPKGDWYGVKSSRDGREAAIPAVVFGGDHADIPLDEKAGAFIAGIVATLEQPAVLDLEHLSKGQQIRFVAAFLQAIYEKNRDPLLLILDELQRWAPQKPISPEHTICLGAAEDVFKLGRKHGLGRLGVTQRGSGANKEVTEIADVLIAHRTPGVLDQERIQGWLNANVGKARTAEVMESVAGLRKGEAIIASAHPEMSMFARIQVRDRTTFDSSATPAIGQKHAQPKVLAKPDIEAIRVQMAETIEKAKADDPRHLKERIRQLEVELKATTQRLQMQLVDERKDHEKQLTRIQAELLKKDASVIQVPTYPDSVREWMVQIADTAKQNAAGLGDLERMLREAAALKVPPAELKEQVSPALRPNPPSRSHELAPRAPRPAPSAAAREIRRVVDAATSARDLSTGNTGISRPQQKLVDALARLEAARVMQPTRTQAAALAGVSPKSSGFEKNVSTLSTAGLLSYPSPGRLQLTDVGRAQAAGADTPPTVDEFLDYIYRLVSGPQATLLRELVRVYPAAMTRQDLAEACNVSHLSSGFEKNVSTLSSFGFVVYPERGAVRASDLIFLEDR